MQLETNLSLTTTSDTHVRNFRGGKFLIKCQKTLSSVTVNAKFHFDSLEITCRRAISNRNYVLIFLTKWNNQEISSCKQRLSNKNSPLIHPSFDCSVRSTSMTQFRSNTTSHLTICPTRIATSLLFMLNSHPNYFMTN